VSIRPRCGWPPREEPASEGWAHGERDWNIQHPFAIALAELDLALLESERCAGGARLGELMRGQLAAIESAMASGLASPLGNFSGGAAALARKARETGRRFVVAVAALVLGAPRRVAAERAPPDACESPQPAHC